MLAKHKHLYETSTPMKLHRGDNVGAALRERKAHGQIESLSGEAGCLLGIQRHSRMKLHRGVKTRKTASRTVTAAAAAAAAVAAADPWGAPWRPPRRPEGTHYKSFPYYLNKVGKT